MSPYGGVLADKYGRIFMVGLADIIAGSALLVQAYYFSTGSVPLAAMLFSNIIFGLAWGIFWPSFSGIMPALITDEEMLQKGNSINQFVSNIALISGAAAAGFMVSAFGSASALTIDALTFVFSGIVVLTFKHKTTRAARNENSMSADLLHGWKVFLSFHWIVAVVAAFSLIVMAWAAAESVLGPLIAIEKFNGAKSWALVLTAESVGYVIGSLIGMRVKPKYPMRFLVISTYSVSFYIFTLAAPQSLWVIALGAFLFGICLDLWGAIWSTALQREVPRVALSRVSAFDAMGSMILRPVGLAMAAPLASALGIHTTLIAFTILTIIVITAALSLPHVWKMQFSANS